MSSTPSTTRESSARSHDLYAVILLAVMALLLFAEALEQCLTRAVHAEVA